VERSTSPVTIEIAAHRDGESLQVTVRNDGILGDAPGAGIGLRNCRERLAVLYGSQATFELESRRKHGRGEVIARLRLPWQRYLA
jgi:LytS/YehU family sensor histidine kinase